MLEPDAKAKLATTVRDLRTRLLKDLHDQADGRYRLGVPIARSGLAEDDRVRRRRLEAWLDEQVDSDRLKGESTGDARARHLLAAEKLAAATLLNRLVVVKLLEAQERIRLHVVTGGWTSAGYRDFREFAPELVTDDPTEGFATLLELLFEDGPRVDAKRDLRTWLRERFFQDDHRKRYEERPVYLPLSSKNDQRL